MMFKDLHHLLHTMSLVASKCPAVLLPSFCCQTLSKFQRRNAPSNKKMSVCLMATAADGSGRKPFVVAIDGPAASGKGTIAKRLAAELQLAHLDTGLLYRGVGWAAISSGVDLADEQAVAALAAQLDMSQLQGNKQLRTDEAAMAASKVSALPAVRAALLQAQRQFAVQPPQHHHGAVLDGRDVGTVICPDAAVKLYITASVEVRAQRRLDELTERREQTSYEAVLADMQARDERDTNRATAPLKPADDAVLLDTSSMSIQDAYDHALRTVTAAMPTKQP